MFNKNLGIIQEEVLKILMEYYFYQSNVVNNK